MYKSKEHFSENLIIISCTVFSSTSQKTSPVNPGYFLKKSIYFTFDHTALLKTKSHKERGTESTSGLCHVCTPLVRYISILMFNTSIPSLGLSVASKRTGTADRWAWWQHFTVCVTFSTPQPLTSLTFQLLSKSQRFYFFYISHLKHLYSVCLGVKIESVVSFCMYVALQYITS